MPFDSQIWGSKVILLLNTAEMRLRKIGKPIFPLTKQIVKHNKSPFPKSEIDPR
jgi:hypothetical protein